MAIDDLQSWATTAVQITGTLGVIASSLSFLLGVIGNKYPPALKWAMHMSDLGLRLHNLGNRLGSMLPGGMPPQLAVAKSIAPRPSMVEICAQCGQSVAAPSTLRTGEKP